MMTSRLLPGLTDEQLEMVGKYNKRLIWNRYRDCERLLPTGFLTEEAKTQLDELKELGKLRSTNRPLTVRVSEVGEEDWATHGSKYYFPVRVTRYLTVVPKLGRLRERTRRWTLNRIRSGSWCLEIGTHSNDTASHYSTWTNDSWRWKVLDVGMTVLEC